METLGDKLVAKSGIFVAKKFYCEKCDYSCSKKYNWDKHLLTSKHSKVTLGDNLVAKSGILIENENYCCEKCNKTYESRNGLWKHQKICYNEKKDLKEEEIAAMKEIMKYLMKENSEMKTMMMEQQSMVLEVVKNGITNTNNSHNTTNSHNKAFNLQFFLNETCKEAMNIGEFVDSLKIQLSDLEKVGEKGYIEGITSIIVKNLKELDVTKRPVHCTDKKRETVYIKDNDKWEKDEDKSQMHKLIKRVVSKNMKMFPKYREIHPDCTTYHSKFGDQYQKIIYESMGGKGDDDYEKNEKIIKNILKQVVVNKDE
jgi:hypothetical protein